MGNFIFLKTSEMFLLYIYNHNTVSADLSNKIIFLIFPGASPYVLDGSHNAGE